MTLQNKVYYNGYSPFNFPASIIRPPPGYTSRHDQIEIHDVMTNRWRMFY